MWVDQPCLRLLLERTGSYRSKQTRMPAWAKLFISHQLCFIMPPNEWFYVYPFSLCKYGGEHYWNLRTCLCSCSFSSTLSFSSTFFFFFKFFVLLSSSSFYFQFYSFVFFRLNPRFLIIVFFPVVLFLLSNIFWHNPLPNILNQVYDLSYIHLQSPLPLQNKIAIFLSCLLVSSFFYFRHVACADVYQRACRLFRGQCGKTKFYNMRTFLETMCPLTCGQCSWISSFAGTHWN